MTKADNNEKENYLAPQIEVIEIASECGILTTISATLPSVGDGGSAFGDNVSADEIM